MFLLNNRTKILYLLLIGGILLSGVLLSAYGFWKSSNNLEIPWESNKVLIKFYGFFFLGFLIIYFLTKFLKNIPLASLAIIVLISIICNKIWCLIAVAGIILSSVILGRLIINKIGLKQTWLDCFLLGIGVIGTIIGLLAHFPVNYSGIYALVLVIFCFLNRKIVIEIYSDVKLWRRNYTLPDSNFTRFGEIFVFALILIYFVVALMPELLHDPLAMHLFVSAKLTSAHFWDFNVNKYA